jgi:hypothetical protein
MADAMLHMDSTGWLAWLTVPMIGLMYAMRRRAGTRVVAGLFLWRSAVSSSGGERWRSALATDLVAASMLALLATRWEFGRPSLDAAVRIIAVVICVVVLAVHWIRK